MRILGIETSSVRGSVALLDELVTIVSLSHERENAHGESILPLVERALAEAGWSAAQLDRVAVGLGPGSFTGLRVGIAIAQGISEGLEVPLVGVPSLYAMALAVPAEQYGVRCALLDARKGELFTALYDEHGQELAAARVAASTESLAQLGAGHSDVLFLGGGVALLPNLPRVFRSSETDLPHARWTALAARSASPTGLLEPLYVRHDVATVPRLPPNPLRSGPR